MPDGALPGIDAGGSDAGDDASTSPPLDIDVTPAPATATVRGVVRDVSTGEPLAATASIGAASAATDGEGSFAFDAPTGHQVLRVTAAGYVPMVLPVGVIARGAEPFSIALAPASAPVSVGAGGAEIDSNGATLSFPVDVYAQATSVTATYVTNLAAAPGELSFVDQAGTGFAVRGALHVDVDAQPTKPVIVRVPVSPGVTVDDARLLTLGEDGEWGDPIAPLSVIGGYATYSVSHFSTIAPSERAKEPSLVVRAVSGSVTAVRPNGDAAAVTAGASYPIGTRFGASSRSLQVRSSSSSADTRRRWPDQRRPAWAARSRKTSRAAGRVAARVVSAATPRSRSRPAQ